MTQTQSTWTPDRITDRGTRYGHPLTEAKIVKTKSGRHHVFESEGGRRVASVDTLKEAAGIANQY